MPDAGAVRIDGRDVTAEAPSRRGVSMVFQSFALFPHMTAAENIGFGLQARRVPAPERATRVAETAEWLGLTGLLDRRPAELSGGERQRVALARSLIGRPRVLLMDEPLSNLDAPLRARIRAEIKRIHGETGVTILYVTHDQAEAAELGDRLVTIDGGRLQRVAPSA
jgi:ABC-type sugar transport system ATPase subunit